MSTFDKVKKYIIYAAIIILSIICLIPFLLTMVNATRSGREIMTSFTLAPGSSIKENWDIMSGYFNIFRGLINSLFIAVSCTVLTSYFSSITAYALAVYRFKGRNILFGTILVFMMIPSQLSLLGFYDLINAMGLTDTYVPLIVPAIASPATIFFLRQYILSVLSPSLLEAARIDGANEIHIFHKIVLPIMSPGIVTMAIGAFIGAWNNYLLPLIILYTPSKFPLPVMMGTMKASVDITANQGAIYLAVAISVLPILIVFAFCSKYIISSISSGSVKE